MKMNEWTNKQGIWRTIEFGIWSEKACSKLFQHVPYLEEMNDTGNDVSFGAKLRVIFEIFTIFLLKGIKLPLLYLMNLATTSCLLKCRKFFQAISSSTSNCSKHYEEIQAYSACEKLQRTRKEGNPRYHTLNKEKSSVASKTIRK